jgi:phosphoglycolate phosphatase-like HAD superfamily hydrolase
MLFVFDLDGTLIESEAAVRAAYQAAGVTMPPGVWGAPVGDWCTPEQHAAKQEAYPQMLQQHASGGRALPLWRWIPATGRVIVTGASEASALAALRWLDIPHHFLALTGADADAKARYISARMASHNPVVYVDCDYAVARSLYWRTSCMTLIP